jgi:hypothetical protein
LAISTTCCEGLHPKQRNQIYEQQRVIIALTYYHFTSLLSFHGANYFRVPLSAFAQGPLTPPGAPAPTMKTLDQVEPRIPLVVGASGVTTEPSYHFVISQRRGQQHRSQLQSIERGQLRPDAKSHPATNPQANITF